ncbi:MAG: hypothetical protein R3E98_01975 [Gemmatimonadota bacterium]
MPRSLPILPRATRLLLAALLLGLPPLTPPLLAQKGSPADPETAARELRAARVPATEAASTLSTTYRQSGEAVIQLLAAAGWPHPEVALASVTTLRMDAPKAAMGLRAARIGARDVATGFVQGRVASEALVRGLREAAYSATEAGRAVLDVARLSPGRAWELLRAAGYTSGELHGAVTELGMAVELGCIDPQGFPVPCGNFGNGSGTPPMGQVTWTPQGSGATGSMVVFEATDIPPLTVLLGTLQLETEWTPTRVRAVLPSHPMEGVLAFRRSSDGVVGVIEESFSVLSGPVADPWMHQDWTGAAAAALAGALADADAWIAASRLRDSHCTVQAVSAIGTPGVLWNPLPLAGHVRTKLLEAGMPSALADAWQGAFDGAFREWADNVTIPGLPWFPGFASFPAAEAPAMTNVPTPLGALVSTGSEALLPAALAQRLVALLPGTQWPQAQASIAAFATDFSASFTLFLATAHVMNVLGEGPVPSFNPLYAPAGPVVGGRCWTPGPWATQLPSGTKVDLPDLLPGADR